MSGKKNGNIELNIDIKLDIGANGKKLRLSSKGRPDDVSPQKQRKPREVILLSRGTSTEPDRVKPISPSSFTIPIPKQNFSTTATSPIRSPIRSPAGAHLRSMSRSPSRSPRQPPIDTSSGAGLTLPINLQPPQQSSMVEDTTATPPQLHLSHQLSAISNRRISNNETSSFATGTGVLECPTQFADESSDRQVPVDMSYEGRSEYSANGSSLGHLDNSEMPSQIQLPSFHLNPQADYYTPPRHQNQQIPRIQLARRGLLASRDQNNSSGSDLTIPNGPSSINQGQIPGNDSLATMRHATPMHRIQARLNPALIDSTGDRSVEYEEEEEEEVEEDLYPYAS